MQEQEKEMRVESISYGVVQCLALMQRGGAQSYFNLMCQAFLAPYGRPYTMKEVDGSGMGGRLKGQEEGGWETMIGM